MSLNNKNIVIVGASGAIGSAVVKALVDDGSRVALVGRTQSKLESLKKSLDEKRNLAEIFTCDATDTSSTESCFQAIIERFSFIDGVFNAIGVNSEHAAKLCTPSIMVEKSEFLDYTNTVVWSQFLTARVAAKYMQARKSGSIVFLTATPARGVAPFMAGHSAGHAAIEGLIRSLATEWGPLGIRVVGVRSAGMPETQRIRSVLGAMAEIVGADREEFTAMAQKKPLLGRMPLLSETAGVVAYLMSNRASSITGAILNSSCGEVLD